MVCMLVLLMALAVVLPAWGKTVFVDKDSIGGPCSDNPNTTTNPGTSPTAPVCSCIAGHARLASGDTLSLRAGRYSWTFPEGCTFYGGTYPGGPPPLVLPSGGGSWETATVIAAFPGETVTLVQGSISLGFGVPAESWIIVDRIHIENGGVNIAKPSHHLRFQNGSIYNTVDYTGATEASSAGMLTGGGGNNFEVLNSDIYNAGGGIAGRNCADSYGCYASYYTGSDGVFDGNRIYDNAGFALHLWNSEAGHTTIVHARISNNVLWNNGHYDLRPIPGSAIHVGSGPGHEVYNNVVFGNKLGITVGYNAHNSLVYNNTIFGNQDLGLQISASENVTVRNNILVNNGGHDLDDLNPGSTVLAGNWETTNGAPGFVNPVTKDFGTVAFPGATSADFHLQQSSLARDVVSCISGFPGVATDITNTGWANSPGVARPQPGGSCDPGAYEFVTGVPGPTGNPIYVSVTGTAADCTVAENPATPASPDLAKTCLTVGGKVAYFRAGTYANFSWDTLTNPIASGTSWDTATRLEAFESEVVILQMASSVPTGCMMDFRNAERYIILDKLRFDGVNQSESWGLCFYDGTDHIRVQNSEIMNVTYAHAWMANADFIELINNNIHHNTHTTTGTGYGCVELYGAVDNVKIEGNEMHHCQGMGLMANSAGGSNTNLVISKNRVHHTSQAAAITEASVTLGAGAGAIVVNNIVTDGKRGIEVMTGAQGPNVYHNTVSKHTGPGLQCNAGAGSTLAVLFTNNISFDNVPNAIVNNCSAITAGNFVTNPQFAGSEDYHLQNTSPALHQGVALASVIDDFDGVPRPFGAGWDPGAYENQTVPPDPPLEGQASLHALFFF